MLTQAGNLATIQGDYPNAQALLEESPALARVLGDKAVSLIRFGVVLVVVADRRNGAAGARSWIERSPP